MNNLAWDTGVVAQLLSWVKAGISVENFQYRYFVLAIHGLGV